MIRAIWKDSKVKNRRPRRWRHSQPVTFALAYRSTCDEHSSAIPPLKLVAHPDFTSGSKYEVIHERCRQINELNLRERLVKSKN